MTLVVGGSGNSDKRNSQFIANFRKFNKSSFEIRKKDLEYSVEISTEDKKELFETYNYIGKDVIKQALNSEILKKRKCLSLQV